MGFARRIVRKSVRKATPRSVRKVMHPVRTTRNAVTPRSVKQLRRGIYTVRNPLGAAENALIGSVLNAGSGRRRSSGSGGRSSAASRPVALPGGVFVGTGVRAGEALRSADQLASLMAVQRDRFAPAVRPQVPDPLPPDRVAMQKAFWESLGTARPSFWQRQKLRQTRVQVAELVAVEATEMHQTALGVAAADRARVDAWWAGLLDGDQATITAALTAAFADNVAPVAVLHAAGDQARLLLLLPDLDALGPKQGHVTPSGRLSSRNWPKADLHEAYASLLGAHLLATARETWAVAPSIRHANVIGLRRATPDSKPAHTLGGFEVLFDAQLYRVGPNWDDDEYRHQVLGGHPHGLRRTGTTRTVNPWPTADLPAETVADLRQVTATA